MFKGRKPGQYTIIAFSDVEIIVGRKLQYGEQHDVINYRHISYSMTFTENNKKISTGCEMSHKSNVNRLKNTLSFTKCN